MGSINWPKVVLTGALAALLVLVGWIPMGLRGIPSLGLAVAGFLAMSDHSRSLIPSGFFETAALVDLTLWYAFVWSARGLWVRFQQCVRARETTTRWTDPLWHAIVPAILCSLQLSFYVVLGLESIPRLKGLFVETLLSAIMVSSVICTALLCALFLLAVQFWPASWARRWDSEKPKFTTLNLR